MTPFLQLHPLRPLGLPASPAPRTPPAARRARRWLFGVLVAAICHGTLACSVALAFVALPLWDAFAILWASVSLSVGTRGFTTLD